MDIPGSIFKEIYSTAYKCGKRSFGKRDEELEDLHISAVSHLFCEVKLQRAFSDGKYKQLPDEVYKRLAFHTAYFEVFGHHVEVFVSADSRSLVVASVQLIFCGTALSRHLWPLVFTTSSTSIHS